MKGVRFIAYQKCMTCGRIDFKGKRGLAAHIAWQKRKGKPHRPRSRTPMKISINMNTPIRIWACGRWVKL